MARRTLNSTSISVYGFGIKGSWGRRFRGNYSFFSINIQRAAKYANTFVHDTSNNHEATQLSNTRGEASRKIDFGKILE
jgi:hypothetical protein